jgi:hypothetical protein
VKKNVIDDVDPAAFADAGKIVNLMAVDARKARVFYFKKLSINNHFIL